jgi:hypothetical protein
MSGIEQIERRRQTEQLQKAPVLTQPGKIDIVESLGAEPRLYLNRPAQIVERLFEGPGLGVCCCKRVEEMGRVGTQPKRLFEEPTRLRKISDVQSVNAAVVEFVGVSRRGRLAGKFLTADLDIRLGTGIDLYFERIFIHELLEERFRFCKLLAIEDTDCMLKSAEGRGSDRSPRWLKRNGLDPDWREWATATVN